MEGKHIVQLQKEFEDWGKIFSITEFKEKLIKRLINDGFFQNNSRLVFSVCSDDINRLEERETIEKTLIGSFGGEFNLGSLAAYPIGGVAGMTAASHHCPNNMLYKERKEGNLIIFINPHLGIVVEEEIKYGKIIRPGQIIPSNCCGAMMGFLEFLKNNNNFKDLTQLKKNGNDLCKFIVFEELIENFKDKLSDILNLKDINQQIIALSKLNYELVLNKTLLIIKDFLKSSQFEGRFVILGGLTINSKDQDFFVHRNYSLNSVSLT